MTQLFNYLLEAIRSPREQLSRGQQFVRKSCELVVYCYRQLQRQRAEGMAAELTYRTIFALIPVVVLGLVLFRVVGGLEDVQSKVENQLFSFFGVPEITAGYAPLDSIETSGDAPTIDVPKSGIEPVTRGDAETDSESSKIEAGGTTRDKDVSDATYTRIDSVSDPSDQDSTEPKDQERSQPADAAVVATLPATQPPLVDLKAAVAIDAATDAADSSGMISTNSLAKNSQSDPEAAAKQARISIRKTLHDLANKVSTVDFASIGVFGLLLFTYAAVALANAAEHLFNRIYEAPSKRPVHLRIAIHWSILTLGGGLLAMSLYLSSQLVEWLGNVEGQEMIKPILSHLASLLASWILLFLVYALMPNTRVSVRAAAIGSAVSAVLWEIAKYGFQIYLSEAVPYSLYGSLGLIPLFLFWIYLTWLLVLFGLTLTYTLQALGGHLPDGFKTEDTPSLEGDPDWMLPIMCEVGHAFEEGQTLAPMELANRIGLSTRSIHELTEHLIDRSLLRKVSSGDVDAALTLARPANKIELVEILDLAQSIRPPHKHPAWKTFSDMKDAERRTAVGKTLADAANW
ncbi:MAG: YihY/virulence factor BrkB family protein [Rubripirellula sp.]|nr:YihY/virulence factor BrkB family protein [Rubripirellula sp.]